jgi:hypothetical protein
MDGNLAPGTPAKRAASHDLTVFSLSEGAATVISIRGSMAGESRDDRHQIPGWGNSRGGRASGAFASCRRCNTVGTTIEWYDFLIYSTMTGPVFGTGNPAEDHHRQVRQKQPSRGCRTAATRRHGRGRAVDSAPRDPVAPPRARRKPRGTRPPDIPPRRITQSLCRNQRRYPGAGRALAARGESAVKLFPKTRAIPPIGYSADLW